MNKFNVGDTVIYTAGDIAYIGIIKEVLLLNDEYAYRVWYHSGDTSALTYEENLHELANPSCFTIIRHSANPNIQYSKARQIAAKILSEFNFTADFYYKLEDWLTDILEERNASAPKGIESEYLCCALRVEIEDLISCRNDITNYTAEDIEACVNKIISHNNKNVLDTDFIVDIITEHFNDLEEE